MSVGKDLVFANPGESHTEAKAAGTEVHDRMGPSKEESEVERSKANNLKSCFSKILSTKNWSTLQGTRKSEQELNRQDKTQGHTK